MNNGRTLWTWSRSLGSAGAVALLLVTQGALAQVTIPLPVQVPEPMPAATPHLRQVTVGRVTGTLRRDLVRSQAARSWAAISGCVSRSGRRVARVNIRFVLVLGRAPELVLLRGAPASTRSCIAQEIATWRFPSNAGMGTAAVTWRTRGLDAAVAGAASRVPVAGEVLRGAGQVLEAGHEALGTQ